MEDIVINNNEATTSSTQEERIKNENSMAIEDDD